MSMAAGYSRNAAAFTRPSPLLRVELTTENRNFRPVSDRGGSENRLPVITILAPEIRLWLHHHRTKNLLRFFV